jgi:hypothetical protein
MLAHRLADSLWLGAAFASPNDRAALIDDANRGSIKRDIEADIMLLIHGNASGGWLPAEANPTFSPAHPPRLRHVPTHITSRGLFGSLLPADAWERVPNGRKKELLEAAPSFSPLKNP